MRKYNLGEFEEIVVLTIAILRHEAYSVSIKERIESQVERRVSFGALHAALVRLEQKFYIKSSNTEWSAERAGRPRKYFQVTPLGKKVTEHSRNTREGLWRAIQESN